MEKSANWREDWHGTGLIPFWFKIREDGKALSRRRIYIDGPLALAQQTLSEAGEGLEDPEVVVDLEYGESCIMAVQGWRESTPKERATWRAWQLSLPFARRDFVPPP